MAARAGGLSEAIRQALTALGADAKGEDIKAFIAREYVTNPDILPKLDTTTFSTTVSAQKKKMYGGGTSPRRAQESAPAPAPGPQPAAAPSENGQSFEHFIEALDDVKELVAKYGKDMVLKLLQHA